MLTRIEAVNPKLNADRDLRHRRRARRGGYQHRTLARRPCARRLRRRSADGQGQHPGARHARDLGQPHLRGLGAGQDEFPIAKLRDGGAVILGKTNCPEFTLQGYTDNLVFGVTRNPWNLALTPGGSSGGAVAAVAAGLGPVAVGTDGGGSIRRPAAHTGLVGLSLARCGGTRRRVSGDPARLRGDRPDRAHGRRRARAVSCAGRASSDFAALSWPAAEPFPPTMQGQSVGPRGHAVFTAFANMAGCPAISIPCAPSKTGLPIGFHLVGRVGHDDMILAAAAQYEALHANSRMPRRADRAERPGH